MGVSLGKQGGGGGGGGGRPPPGAQTPPGWGPKKHPNVGGPGNYKAQDLL